MKTQHLFQRNVRQPVCRLPVDVLVQCLSFLSSAKDQLSVIRVCRHLRAHVIDSPSLWTCVNQIHHPTALSFVLERAKGTPIDILNLRVGPDNDQLLAVAAHMRHIRTLNLHIDHDLLTDACTAFSTPAPLLQALSIHGSRSHFIKVNWSALIASNCPRLSRFQTSYGGLDGSVWGWLPAIQSLHTFSLDFVQISAGIILEYISKRLPTVTTMNLQLMGWDPSARSPSRPTLHRINIRWIKPGPFVPGETIPDHESWNSVPVIYVAHVSDSPSGPSQADLTGAIFPIPAQAIPYRRLWIRTSGQNVHVRVVHQDERERVFCGLHPTTVSGVPARIPGLELTTLTVATTAIALSVLSNSTWPALRRLRLVYDTHDTAWVSVFARDAFNIPTLEYLEMSIDQYVVSDWNATTASRVLGCCIAAGHVLQKVSFLGFAPEPRCVAGAEVFADEVVVERWWREPESERVWFTEPAFEW